MQARQIRRALGQESDDAELAGLLRSAVADLDPEDAPAELAQAMAGLLSVASPPDADVQAVRARLDALLSLPVAQIAEGSGSDAAIRYLGAMGPLLAALDPARGRRLFAEAAGFVAGLRERGRFAMLAAHVDLLWSPQGVQEGDLEATDLPPGQAPQDARAMPLRRAAERGWSQERTAITLLCLAGVGPAEETDPGNEVPWIRIIAELPGQFPAALDGHLDALRYQVAGLTRQVASPCPRAG